MDYKVRDRTENIDFKTAIKKLVNAQVYFILNPNIETVHYIIDECQNLGYYLSDNRIFYLSSDKKESVKDALILRYKIERIKSYYSEKSQSNYDKGITRSPKDIALLLMHSGSFNRLNILSFLANCMCDTKIASKNPILVEEAMNYAKEAIQGVLEPEEIEIIKNRHAVQRELETIIEKTPLWAMLALNKA